MIISVNNLNLEVYNYNLNSTINLKWFRNVKIISKDINYVQILVPGLF